MKRNLSQLILLTFPLLLILFATQTKTGAEAGLILWFHQILPVLFPFSFVLQFIMSTEALDIFSRITAPATVKIFHLSPACSFCILSGFLCGFPMGTITSVQAYQQNLITKEEAQLLIGTCNHASPMFLTGYILDKQLTNHPFKPFLILIFYLAPLFWLWIRCYFLFLHSKNSALKSAKKPLHRLSKVPASFRSILLSSSETMLKIGFCMMFFSIILEILNTLPFITPSIHAVTALLLEITNGSAAISCLPWSVYSKTLFIISGTAFGGLCAAFQSYTMLHAQKLSFTGYLADKSAVGIITAALIWSLYHLV